MMNLAEIVFSNLNQADSAYEALVAGEEFSKMVVKYSIGSSRINNGYLGSTNIQNYSKNISSALSDLKEDEFTKPLPYGQNFIIFKRLKNIESVDKKETIKNKENFFIESKSYVTL
jgi:parvulin-like peptidyl-prolyl isomerase